MTSLRRIRSRTSRSWLRPSNSRERPEDDGGERRVVEATLIPDGDDTILALRHTGLPGAFRAMHDEGWRHSLPLLEHAAADAPE